MIFAKFETPALGQFWLQIECQDNRHGEEQAKGIALGWGLGREEPFELVDIRLSKHPTEPLRSVETVQQFLREPEKDQPL